MSFNCNKIVMRLLASMLLLGMISCGNDANFSGTGFTSDQEARPNTSGRTTDTGTPVDTSDVDTTDSSDLTQVSLTFDPNEVSSSIASLNLDSPYLESQLEMQREYNPRKVGFTQITRSDFSDRMVQGKPGTANTESFSQKSATKLDLLIVVDNSMSMQEEQVNLGTKLAPLLSEVKDSDWRIGVTTTDPYDGCLRSVLNKGEADLDRRFASAVNAGINGTGYERGLYQAVSALSCSYNPWVRSDSSLVILFVSDEDNCSDGTECGNAADASKDYLMDYLSSIRKPGVDARVYGLIWHPSVGQDQCSTGDNQANIYADIIEETSGTWGSVCSEDYSSTLKAISKDIASILTTKYDLQHIPDNGSVAIYIDNVPQNGTFEVKNNTINFNETPAPGAEIKVSYRYGGRARFEQITLSKKAAQGSVNVAVDGVALDPTKDFSFNPATNKVHFASKPTDGAIIEVDYKDITPLLDNFLLPGAAVVKTLSVKVDGSDLPASEYTYNPSSYEIKFKEAPTDGSQVSMDYTERGNEILNYTFDIGTAPESSLEVLDLASGSPVAFTYKNKKVSIKQNAWTEGKRVVLRYKNVSRDSGEMILAHDALDGTIEVSSDSKICAAGKVFHSGKVVNFSNCDFSVTDQEVSVSYDYVSNHKTKFLFDVQPGLDPEKIEWTVLVGGLEELDFERQGWLFKFPNEIEYGNSVEISATYE